MKYMYLSFSLAIIFCSYSSQILGTSVPEPQCCRDLRYDIDRLYDHISRLDRSIEDIYYRLDQFKTTTTPKPTTTTTTPKPTPKYCPRDFTRFPGDDYNCYMVGTFKKSWEDAHKWCQYQHEKAHLAVVKYFDQDRAITDYLRRNQWEEEQCYMPGDVRPTFYIAGQRKNPDVCDVRSTDFYWRYNDVEEKFGYTNWEKNEPNCYGKEKEGCVQYRCSQYECGWNDYACEKPSCFLCQVEWW